MVALVELLGPSRLIGWEDGEPVAGPHPRAWVSVAAVGQEQTYNTIQMIQFLASQELIDETGLEFGVELIRAYKGKVRLEASTSNWRALEGKRITFQVCNETQHWVSGNGGHKLMETIRGNVTKTTSRLICITNAYLPSEESVAQVLREKYDAHLEKFGVPQDRVLYDTIEANPKTPLSGPLFREALLRIRGDATWLNPDEIEAEIGGGTGFTTKARARRMWLNQILAESDALHGPETWDHLGDTEEMLEPGDEVVLGFDGGKTDDSTALVAIRVRDHCAFLIHLQERPDDSSGQDWEVDRRKVDSAVHEAFRTYTVRAFFADVSLWESYISDWSDAYGAGLEVKGANGPIAFDMRRNLEQLTRMHEGLLSEIWEDRLKHDGNRLLRRHVLNVKRRDNQYGVYFDKDSRTSSMRKIDAYAALLLAHGALEKLRLNKPKKRERSGRTWFA